MIPDNLLYTKDHEWLKIDGSQATIGITDHAQEALGEITYVELPPVGKELQASTELAVIESVKAASDVFSPLAGKVTEVNSDLEEQYELVNSDCYGAGWIAKIQLSDPSAASELMTPEQYEKFLETV